MLHRAIKKNEEDGRERERVGGKEREKGKERRQVGRNMLQGIEGRKKVNSER